jgi:hypothetical protein
MSAANLGDLLHLVLPLLVKGDTAKIESIIGVVEFICLAIEKIAKEYAPKNKTVASTDKVTLAFQAGGQVVDFLHNNKIISDSLAFDAKAVIGVESILSGMISDIIKIWNNNRQIQAAAAEIKTSCCGCWPWSRGSKKSVYSSPGVQKLGMPVSPIVSKSAAKTASKVVPPGLKTKVIPPGVKAKVIPPGVKAKVIPPGTTPAMPVAVSLVRGGSAVQIVDGVVSSSAATSKVVKV